MIDPPCLPTTRRHHPDKPLVKLSQNDFASALAGRDESTIERGIDWTDEATADTFATEGVTLFTTEIHPDENGYNFSELEKMLAWRDR